MANEKKYIILESLQAFKNNADNLYATKQSLSDLSAYILNIDYNTLAFDTSEIVIDMTSSSTSSILGQAVLGKMILA